MVRKLTADVRIQAGGRIEIESDQLPEGQIARVEVYVATGEVLDYTSFLGSVPRSFSSPEEVDRHISDMRDEWAK